MSGTRCIDPKIKAVLNLKAIQRIAPYISAWHSAVPLIKFGTRQNRNENFKSSDAYGSGHVVYSAERKMWYLVILDMGRSSDLTLCLNEAQIQLQGGKYIVIRPKVRASRSRHTQVRYLRRISLSLFICVFAHPGSPFLFSFSVLRWLED